MSQRKQVSAMVTSLFHILANVFTKKLLFTLLCFFLYCLAFLTVYACSCRCIIGCNSWREELCFIISWLYKKSILGGFSRTTFRKDKLLVIMKWGHWCLKYYTNIFVFHSFFFSTHYTTYVRKYMILLPHYTLLSHFVIIIFPKQKRTVTMGGVKSNFLQAFDALSKGINSNLN